MRHVRSARYVQEVLVLFVVFEDVVDYLCLGPTHDVVVLTAFGEMDFGSMQILRFGGT